MRLSLKKVPLFVIKNIDYSYTPGYALAIDYLAPRVKKHTLGDAFLSYFA